MATHECIGWLMCPDALAEREHQGHLSIDSLKSVIVEVAVFGRKINACRRIQTTGNNHCYRDNAKPNQARQSYIDP